VFPPQPQPPFYIYTSNIYYIHYTLNTHHTTPQTHLHIFIYKCPNHTTHYIHSHIYTHYTHYTHYNHISHPTQKHIIYHTHKITNDTPIHIKFSQSPLHIRLGTLLTSTPQYFNHPVFYSLPLNLTNTF